MAARTTTKKTTTTDDTTSALETTSPVVPESSAGVSQAEAVAAEAEPQVVTTTPVTAYGFTKIVNKMLEEAGLKVIPPQMIYSYKAKGLLGTDEKPLTAEYAVTWTTNYMERKVARTEAQRAKVEAELKGETTHTVDIVEPDVSTETADADVDA